MPKALVLFINGSALQVDNIKRGEDGRVYQAGVINGAWRLSINNGEVRYGTGGDVRPLKSYEEVSVNAGGDDDYNDVIERARKLRGK